MYAAPPPPPPQNKGLGTGAIVLIVVLVAVVPIVGILSVLAIYGARRYIVNAKTAEARSTVAQIAKDAVVAYQEKRRICPSATAPIPADKRFVSGRKYQSSAAEWQADRSADAGFACLKFDVSIPQYFQYEYQATAIGFVVRAHGDLNGDGVFSTYELEGRLVGDQLVVPPNILETNPLE
jgi:Tfp pilus assembly protein PilE